MEGAQRREARSSATNPLLNSGLNSGLSPFSDFLQSKMKAFCFIWLLALSALTKSRLSWRLWERLPCFCNIGVTGNLLTIELSAIPAYKA